LTKIYQVHLILLYHILGFLSKQFYSLETHHYTNGVTIPMHPSGNKN